MRVVLLWLAGGGLVAVAGVLAQLGRPAAAPPPRGPAARPVPERVGRPQLVLPPGAPGHVEFARELAEVTAAYLALCEERAGDDCVT